MINTIHIPAFERYVCPGDYIIIKHGNFTIRATIEPDAFSSPYDDYPIDCPDYGGENLKIIDAWRRGDWFYCGIVLTAKYNDVPVSRHAAGLWKIEANFPDSDNSHLQEVVEELLLAEALEKAKEDLEILRRKLMAS